MLAAVVAGASLLIPSVAAAQVEDELKEADTAYERGDWKKAAANYDRAIKKAPQRVAAAAYAKRASIFLILASNAKSGGNEALYKALLEEGLKFIAQKAEGVYPDSAEVMEQKALLLWALKSKPDAVKLAEKVVAKKPSAFAVQKILGEFYSVREPARAVKALEAFFEHRPAELEKSDVLPRIHLGFALLSVAKSVRRTKRDEAKKLADKARAQFELLLKKHDKRAHAAVNANNGLCAAYTFIGEYNRAITVCEKIIQNPRAVDRAGSVYFNLGQAYLENKQPRKARTVGREYIRLRKSEAKGYILVGDSFYQERNWTAALEQFQKAEEYAKSSSDYAADIGIRLGISYRRTNNLDLAIAKLESALEIDPNNTRLISELGAAYMADKQDDKAMARAEALIKGEQYAGLDATQKVDLLVLAGSAAYNLANIKSEKTNKYRAAPSKARGHFAAAYELRKRDVKVLMGLVRTINLQAFRAYEAKDVKKAEAYLNQALAIGPKAELTNQNLAVLDIERGDCSAARKRLAALAKSRSYALMYNRLMARTYLCGKREEKRAADYFAKAEKEAGNLNLVRAEIYTEWAPLIWDKQLDKAVEMLEAAVQYTAQNRTLAPAAQRNLALALFRRGWRTMRSGGNKGKAAEDFARASRDPGLLKGTELEAFEFSEALARLEQGNTATASKLFSKLAKSKQSDYLKAPYDKVGAQFFAAYADYRSSSAASRRKAVTAFNQLSRGAKGSFGAKVRELIAASYHEMAVDAYKDGKAKTAASNLNSAKKYATGAQSRDISHNQAVARLGGKFDKGALSLFSGMGTNPPEALANKGILLDRQGKPKEAYDAWVQARSKGVRSGSLNKWIDAKKRIFGY